MDGWICMLGVVIKGVLECGFDCSASVLINLLTVMGMKMK